MIFWRVVETWKFVSKKRDYRLRSEGDILLSFMREIVFFLGVMEF